MKFCNKLILFCVIIILISILMTFVYTKNKTEKQVDMVYYSKITESYFLEADSVYNISSLILNDFDNISIDSIVSQLSALRISLKKIEMAVELTSPHYNLNSKHEYRSLNNISDLFRIYELIVSEWQNIIVKSFSDFQKNKNIEKKRLKQEIENLNSDFNILKDIDFTKLTSFTENNTPYWENVIRSLKSESVIKAYKKAYQ